MKDDMDTNTMNVMFDGSDDTDKDDDSIDLEELVDKVMKEHEDDYNMYYRLKRYRGGR